MSWKEEIDAIAEANDGIVKPEWVVYAGKEPTSALHPKFTWDDKEAGAKRRLDEARFLLRAYTVRFEIPDGDPVRVRAYPLMGGEEVGEYRQIAKILSDENSRMILLADALKEMMAFQRKYGALAALAEVFAAMDKVHT